MSKGRRRWISCIRQRENKFTLDLPFSSVLAISGFDDAHSHWEELSALLSLPIQMVISSGSSFTDIPRNNVLSAIQASLSPGKLTYKINHLSYHSILFLYQF